ncbi:Spermatogenesis-associated protein 13 APC-stimulated guanine nucleotide exchange factor 2 [Larimichthys crocea]|uniref:Spermatogenesis-associated protein 13 APC-stimulated guanine nucleotide exchange factor 2 n=2 Tax=Larimichthys crocea TaxID=215358 RepID=A0A6G0HKW7_LARCR|nr:Spermatogenesis-associated protein 13 APC-stimulated guanine nucleotide exchange factor 2 [Larimichthys crocea]
MSRAEQKDRVLSTSEDPLKCLHNSKADPLLRSRPLSDIYPFHGHADRGAVPYLLSGCGAQIQPMTAGPNESRLNGINSSAWSAPVIGQPEGKPYSSRIMKLFSNSKKGPIPAHSPTTDCSTSNQSSDSNGAQPWPGLSGLGVVDSFKKLRSSVLQGIQSRGAVPSDGEHIPSSNQEMANGTGVDDARNHFKLAEGHSCSNGSLTDQKLVMSHYGSDIEDYDDEENDEGDGLRRNTRFSRSIRRAYGAGRISLLDTVNGRVAGRSASEAARGQKLDQTSSSNTQPENVNENTNVKALSRMSKSAENLHIFKAPFRRKAPSPGPSSPLEDPQRTSMSNGTPSIQRTASASSVDLRGRKKSPVKTKGPMLKLVGSMTDLTVRRKRSPSPNPTSPSLMSPLSRLHDDYSRRVPCLTTSERQRRPSPIRARVLSVGHTPLVLPQPAYDVGPQQHQVLISPVVVEPPERTETTLPGISAHYESAECDSSPLNQKEPSQQQEQTEMIPNEVTSDQQRQEAPLQTEDVSPTTSSTPAVSPTCLPEPPTSTSSPTDTSPTSSTETASVKSRRRSGRPRPRPISDYGQLISRKHSIPEEVAELRAEERTANALLHKDCSGDDSFENGESPESCSMNGDIQGRRQRPISVIGVVDLFPPDAEEKDDSLPSPLSRPPIPSHQVPPYRAVSARFRPSTLSQSTPIGLDRVGRRKLHRVLSDGMSECSATLDDSVSEEEEGSFDELTDVTPHLQPGVELSVLNEWISSGHAVNAEALWDHVTMEEQELAFKAGDVIRVLDASHTDWWWGRGADREAWFPSSFVRVRVNQEDSSAESVESVADQENPSPRDTHSAQHKEQMRTNVVQEIMNTERIYIKHLKDICEGYIRQCRKHPDMFTELQLKTIFSNIEDLYKFQRQFLRDLEKKYNKDQPHLSEIGSCFLMQGEGFSIYSDYCNTHPAACAELQRLMKSGKYKHFFEACRLLQQMINISIAGFLLTPVQKICKYPLQLGELLKYTPKDHSDYSGVSKAYEAMKNVASLINERKRRLESVDTIAHWQVAILHWEGSDVLERSSELIHSGEMTRIVRQGKMQQRSFFLFDHQLVFCKKDVLRRDLLHYRDRLDMDQTEVVDVPDGRDLDLGLTLRNALRLRNAFTLEFMCVLCCRKPQDKQRWLEAFAKERYRVKEDQEMGMEISAEQRKQAIVNARRAKQGKSKSIGYSGSVPPHHQNLHPLHQRHITIPTSVPQQQVFSLAEPPKRKPYHLLYNITRSAFFRK